MNNMKNIDLHCHLDGSLDIEFMRKTSGIQNMEELMQHIQVDHEVCQNLTEYLEKFDLPLKCMSNMLLIEEASERFVYDLKDDNIGYCEVRFSPILLEKEDLSAEQVLVSVLKGLEKGSQATGIETKVIICAMRHHSMETNLRVFSLASKYLGKGVCAVDLAGDESMYPMNLYKELFSYAKLCNLPFTIHAGECGDEQNIVDAIELGAKRIGHGIAMRGNVDLQKFCASKGVAVEMCPVSNFQTKAVSDFKTYPLYEFLNNGVAVTINTDNRTVSNTSITKEFRFIEEHFGITEADKKLFTQNAMQHRF